MHKGYTLNYFIDFFSEIPSSRWTEGTFATDDGNRLCALGHALAGPNPSKARLTDIHEGDLCENARTLALQDFLDHVVEDINDDVSTYSQLGHTPRARILKALRNRKKYGHILGKDYSE
jgi:hypothetical protein